MDWGGLLGFAFVLTLAIVMLRLLWFWSIALIVFGPPALAGIAAGHIVGTYFESFGAGLVTAVLVTGVVTRIARLALRAAL